MKLERRIVVGQAQAYVVIRFNRPEILPKIVENMGVNVFRFANVGKCLSRNRSAVRSL